MINLKSQIYAFITLKRQNLVNLHTLGFKKSRFID